MPTPPELIVAREALEALIRGIDVVRGIDIGVRDEQAPNADDLAVRIFVRDLEEAAAVQSIVSEATAQFGVPIVLLRRDFSPAAFPDRSMHRPVEGGVSVGAARFADDPSGFPVGTLGAIAGTTATPSPLIVGLSNYHVLCVDGNRTFGDEIIQPEPFIGRLPGDRIGSLASWAFPEMVYSGTVDAAICIIEVDWLPRIADLGNTAGTVAARPLMMVTKRGRTTGQTFGWISGTGGTYKTDYPKLPPVGDPPATERELTNQIQVHIDFPLTAIFSESGDSGSVLVESGSNRIVGLHWGSGYESPGDPIKFGLASPIEIVEQELRISLTF